MQITKHPKSATVPYGHLRVVPDDFDGSKEYPLVVHCHGVGGNGNGSETDLQKLVNGELPEQIQKAVDAYKIIVIATQVQDYSDGEIDYAIGGAVAGLKINRKKMYLGGTSFGGGRITRWASKSVENAKKFAAIVSSCGLNWISSAKNLADSGTPMLFFHAQDDGTVNVSATNSAVSSINQYPMAVPAKKIIYTGGQHWIWNKVFHATENPWTGNESPKTIWDYLLMLEVGSPVPVPTLTPDVAMIVDAGPDREITSDKIMLDGSRSRNYAKLSWSIDRCPAGIDIWKVFYKGAGYHTVDAQLEKPGVYIFKLTGVDKAGAKAEDTVMITYSTAVPAPTPAPAPFVPTHLIKRQDGTHESVRIETL